MKHRIALSWALLLSVSASAQQNDAVPVVQPRAEDLRDILSARSYGMGNAWRALGQGADTGTGNPASAAAFPTYRIELTGGWDWKGKDAFASAAITDASTSLLAASVAYQLVSLGKGAERATANLTTLALALPLAESLLIGVSSRYLLMRGAREANAFTGDAGLIFRPSPAFSLGFSAHNLIDTHNAELTRYYSLHAAVVAGVLTAAADVRGDFITNPQSTFTYSGGLEFLIAQQFPLRAGYTWDGFTRSSQLGFGLGLVTQGGGVDLAYRQDIGGEGGKLIALTIKVQVR